MGASLYQELNAASERAHSLEQRAMRMDRLLREAIMDYAERMPKEWIENANKVING